MEIKTPQIDSDGTTNVWGEKTLKANQDTLQKANVRGLLLFIREGIESFAESFIYEKPNKLTVKYVLSGIFSFLEGVKDKGAIEEFDANAELKLRTWKELYPKAFDRLRAKLYKVIGKIFKTKLYYSKPVIWQHLFPFRVKHYIPDILFFMKKDWIEESIPNCDFMLEVMEIKWKNNPPDIEWITEWLTTKMPDPIYEVEILVPYYYIDTDIYIYPKKAVDSINYNIIIDNKS